MQCDSQGMQGACYNMDSSFERANKQVSSISALLCLQTERDGIFVGSELYRINVAYDAEAKLWDIIWFLDHRVK